MKLTPAQRSVLELAGAGRIDAMTTVICKVQQRTLRRLLDAGLLRYQPYARQAGYVITRAGREVLASNKT